MNPLRLGIVSVAIASLCCAGPLLLVALGLGSLGFGAALGRYHGWFIGAAIVLLTYAWRSYLKEVARCKAASCEMARGKTTRTILTLGSVVVALFVGLNVVTYPSPSHRVNGRAAPSDEQQVASAVIPVEGMTCFTCELTVESSVKGLAGVRSVDAKVKDAAAYVEYDSLQVSVPQLIEAINKTGYKAKTPE